MENFFVFLRLFCFWSCPVHTSQPRHYGEVSNCQNTMEDAICEKDSIARLLPSLHLTTTLSMKECLLCKVWQMAVFPGSIKEILEAQHANFPSFSHNPQITPLPPSNNKEDDCQFLYQKVNRTGPRILNPQLWKNV